MQVMYLFRSLSTTVQNSKCRAPFIKHKAGSTRTLFPETFSFRKWKGGCFHSPPHPPPPSRPLRFNSMDTGIVCHLCTRFNNLLFALAFSRYARKASEIVGNIFIDTIPTFCRRSAYFTISNLCQLS